MYFDQNSIIENNNLDNMSTTLVSPFYDVGDVLSNKNQKNNQLRTHYCTERRATIGNLSVASVPKNRNLSTGSFIPIGNSAPAMSVPLADNSLLTSRDCTIREHSHRKLDRSMSEPVGALNNVNNSAQRNQNVNSSRYKTELCRPYEESGHCKYGDKCQFAHGAQELRTLSRHPKYKTELCRTFHTIGFCPYGPRCHFIHNEEERNMCKHSTMSAAQQAMVNKNANLMSSTQVPSQPVQSSSNMDQLSQVKRPSTINFNSSYNGSLGSSSESLSSSASDSPSLSPTFWGSDDIFRDIPQYSSSRSNSSTSSSPVFNYSADLSTSSAALANLLSPLNVQTSLNNQTQSSMPTASDINLLQQQLNVILNLNQCNKNHQAVFDNTWDLNPAPHSPPESISGESVGSTSSIASGSSLNGLCGSALDISKSLRLPIFNQLSHDD